MFTILVHRKNELEVDESATIGTGTTCRYLCRWLSNAALEKLVKPLQGLCRISINMARGDGFRCGTLQ